MNFLCTQCAHVLIARVSARLREIEKQKTQAIAPKKRRQQRINTFQLKSHWVFLFSPIYINIGFTWKICSSNEHPVANTVLVVFFPDALVFTSILSNSINYACTFDYMCVCNCDDDDGWRPQRQTVALIKLKIKYMHAHTKKKTKRQIDRGAQIAFKIIMHVGANTMCTHTYISESSTARCRCSIVCMCLFFNLLDDRQLYRPAHWPIFFAVVVAAAILIPFCTFSIIYEMLSMQHAKYWFLESIRTEWDAKLLLFAVRLWRGQ